MAQKAWLWVLAATCPTTAGWVRKALISAAPISFGCRFLWKRMKLRHQS